MSQQVPFIGRENELAQIDEAIGLSGESSILFIDATGGIGKTRLLQEVRKQYLKISTNRSDLFVTEILDFDDSSLHIPLNLGIKIARMLGEDVFQPYLQEVINLRKMEEGNFPEERLQQQQAELTRTYIHCFNQISAKQKILLLLDTIEAIPEKYRNDIFNPALHFQNCVILAAGRNARQIGESFHNEEQKGIRIIDLPPLETKDRKTYLQHKQSLLHIALDTGLAEKLLFLAGGKPILIDLAMEWIAREIPLPWLAQKSLQEISELPKGELEKLQNEFEHRLVLHIGETRRPIDWLFLAMSYVYPLDTEMISQLLQVKKQEARLLFDEALTYPFVKRMPDERIKLHDEMQRMVNQYVWLEVDPNKDIQKQYSHQAIGYLETEIQNLQDQINQLEADEQALLSDSIRREVLKEELWGLKEQLLKHAMALDVDKGVNIFVDLFEEATRAYRFRYRKTLLDHVETYLDTLSESQKFEFNIRYAKYLLDNGEYVTAKIYLNANFALSHLLPEQYIDTHIQLANVIVRLGKFIDGIDEFKKAVDLSTKHSLQDWQVKSETGLGWAYRLIADFKQAKEHYVAALELAQELGETTKRQQALLYNNLGFVFAYDFNVPGHREKAQWFCEQSLKLAEELDEKRSEGRSYCTLGCIQVMDGRFHHAMDSFHKALDIFEPAQDLEWLSTIYSWRGAIYLSWQNLDKAEEDINRSLEMGIQKDTPLSLSRLAMINILRYLEDNNKTHLDNSIELVDKCYQLSLEQKNVWYQLIGLRDKARVAFYAQKFGQLDELKTLLDQYLEQNPNVQERRALGMLYLFLGGLALGQENTQAAILLFQDALKQLALVGLYGGDTLPIHFERLQNEFSRILHVSSATIREIGNGLLNFWSQDKDLKLNHPDIRTIFFKWANWR